MTRDAAPQVLIARTVGDDLGGPGTFASAGTFATKGFRQFFTADC